MRDEGSDWIDRECRRRYEGREFISFSHMLAFRMNWASGVVMMRGRKGQRYDIDDLLVAADMAFCWRGDFNICDAEKAGESVGEDGV